MNCVHYPKIKATCWIDTIGRYRNMSPLWGFCVVVSAINYKHSAPNGAKVSAPERREVNPV